ncbi:MAG TPA: VIT family protein [Candidatus Saccharimonadales bacterium]|nr:VIT family protein [Candidatus Saccharimonadales bacterium]
MSRHKKFEPHHQNTTSKLNKLRAAVLGANDGIVSIAGLVVGVAGATTNRTAIFTAGIAGILAGAFSMAAGEYVSVSSQRDTERALLKLEKSELEQFPEQELEELTEIYISKGLSAKTAESVAKELTARDAYRAHLDAELAINPDDLVNPWQAAFSSAAAFFAGSLLPMLAIMLPPENIRVAVTFVSTVVALAINGGLSARFGGAPVMTAIMRVVTGGALAMIVTYTVGRIIGTTSL